jgi:hypothetical protein
MNSNAKRMDMRSEGLIRLWKETKDSWNRQDKYVRRRHTSRDTISNLMYELYVYPIRLCMHEEMFYVASKHCRANLVSERIPVKRQILSVHDYDKIPLWMVSAK